MSRPFFTHYLWVVLAVFNVFSEGRILRLWMKCTVGALEPTRLTQVKSFSFGCVHSKVHFSSELFGMSVSPKLRWGVDIFTPTRRFVVHAWHEMVVV